MLMLIYLFWELMVNEKSTLSRRQKRFKLVTKGPAALPPPLEVRQFRT